MNSIGLGPSSSGRIHLPRKNFASEPFSRFPFLTPKNSRDLFSFHTRAAPSEDGPPPRNEDAQNDAGSLEKEFMKAAAPYDPDIFFNQTIVHARAKPFTDQWVAGPQADLNARETFEAIMAALRDNAGDDSGIQVAYRFADIDPWSRSRFFGRSFDLGQFERFRRIMHSGVYFALLNHKSFEVINALEEGEDGDIYAVRVEVNPRDPLEAQEPRPVFQFTLRRRVGGRYSGFWFVSEILAEGIDWSKVWAS